MKCPPTVLALVVAAAMVFPASSSARTQHGNDGDFCTSKAYLAYDDLELSETTGVVTSHSLRIVRFEAGRGIYFSEQVNLPPPLAVHWMSWNAERIELEGHIIRDPLPTKCVIEIAGPPHDAGTADCTDDLDESPAKLRDDPSSLAIFPSTAPIPLESLDPTHKYPLVRHLSQRRVAGAVEFRSKGEIVQLDRRGTILSRLVIYDNRVLHYPD
jgi:hypothetical protein